MIHQPRGNPRQTTMATVYLLAVLVITFCLTTVANVGAQSSDTPIYTIVSPAKIRPNSDYHLSFQLYNTTEPVNINVSISGPSTDGPFNQVTKSVLVNPAETRILNLEIGEWSKGNYKLFVEGSVGGQQIFANNTALQFEPKSYSIFVQTDKSVYKPGQTVRFRAIIVNPSLIPNVVGTLDIYIKDSKDNLIKQWKRIFPHRGVVSEQFVLSEQPPLGDWTIMVDVVGQKASKVFSVAEYVLPTFSVEVRLPPYATYNRSDVVATVKATYTYGKPVKGEVTLTVQPRIRHSSFSFRPLEQYQTKMKIYDEGSVDIPVNIVRDLNLKTDFFEREIEFFALVEEGLTGRKYNKSAVMKIYHKEVKVELIKTSKTFKPGLKYTAYLKVAYQDDSPVDDNGPPLTLKYGYSYNDDAWNNTIVEVPVKGLIRIDLFPPRSTVDSKVFIIGWRAEYRGQTYFLEGVDCAQSPSNNFLQVISKNIPGESTNSGLDPNVATVGGEVSFEINCTEPIKHIVYEVMGKGDIVLARNVRSTLLEGGTSFEITIPVTHKMAPKARLLVYYVRDENQELVADALNFKVDGVFKTPVSLSSDVTQTKPGSLVSLQIHTKPNAYVGLLGVDQSVLLLKSGNDITQQDVLDELESYDSGKRSDSGYSPGGGNWLYRPMFWSGSSTAGEIFDDSGVVILTNGLVHRQIQARLGKRIFYNSDGEGVLVPNVVRSSSRAMANIRLDDTILEDQLQPPNFKLVEKPESRIVLRKEFPETWIWANLTTGLDGAATYQDSIPDTITSWYVSAFAVDSITGLGVAPDSLKISVFRPFFVKLSLPYSLIRGESVALQAIIFNYQKKPIQAEVTMFNPKDDFEFTNAANEIEFAGKTEIREKRKTVTIPPYDGVSVTFLITPKKLGYIDLRVEAKSDNAGDAVIRKLLVKPEGQTQYFNKAFFIKSDLPDSVQSRNISVDIANNAVPGSVRVTVSGISDILGPTVNNIDDLLRMPYGCGEQNMINLVPNIVVLNYLTRVNRLSQAIKAKAVGHIETGYQRELTYRRDDGSFSAFGASDKAGSTWLTAFVAKSFIQARPYIDIDPAIVTRSIEWLLTRQKKDGSFAEYGEVHNKALQGGSALKLGSSANETSSPSSALTSYVLIAILHESKMGPDSIRTKNQQAISRAEDFIYSQIAGSSNPYEVAIGAYALHLANSDRKEFAYKRMMSLVKRDSDGLMYWTLQKDDPDNKTTTSSERLRKVSFGSAYLLYPNALDVETSSYALLTLVLRSDIDNSIPVLRWLISKQNSNGGFSSTQDTVVGLQSLGAIAQRISTATVKMAVEIKHGNSLPKKSSPEFSLDSQTLHFNTDNSLVLQQIQLDPETEWVNLEASGFGTAIVQVSYQYNLAVSAEKPAFFLNPQKDKTSTENYLQLSVCTYYKDGNSTNMAVMEVELPSGYSADVEALPAATRAKEVKRVDTANNDGTVFIYLDRVTRDELCITVPAHRTHRVANNKPVPVTIYDYYDRSKLSRIFYEPTLVTFCDICPQNEIECSARCPSRQSRRLSNQDQFSDELRTSGNPNGATTSSTSWIILASMTIVVHWMTP